MPRRGMSDTVSIEPSTPAAPSFAGPAPRISFVSLGCPKALVDSERIITQLRAEGYELSKTHAGSDLVIVNTCGFLDSAKEESLAAIGDAMERQRQGHRHRLHGRGSPSQHPRKLHPNVLADHRPAGNTREVVGRGEQGSAPPRHDPFDSTLVPDAGHASLTPRHYAYLKISEGCNNRCTFCIIPSSARPTSSRDPPAHHVLIEAEKLVKRAGVKELLVISQDTSAYGVDLRYATSPWRDGEARARFVDLARDLGSLGAWVRLHYVYPYPHVDDVIPLMAEGLVLPYLDMPLQHASPSVLRAMRRPGDQEKMLERIRRWREICPDLTLRSTFIVGFPGETDDDFEALLAWLDEAKLDRVGAFQYEPVGGAPANDLGRPAVPPELKAARHRRFMERQQAIGARKLRAKVGRRLKVILDEGGPTGGIGRTMGDAPEIDGKVRVTSRRPIRTGEIITVNVKAADSYDLFADHG